MSVPIIIDGLDIAFDPLNSDLNDVHHSHLTIALEPVDLEWSNIILTVPEGKKNGARKKNIHQKDMVHVNDD